jgi:hypothetical protein
MWKVYGWVVLLFALLPRVTGATEPSAAESPPPEPARIRLPRPWYYLTRLEATALALLPGAEGGTEEGFLQVDPLLLFTNGPGFSLSLGPPVRLRLSGGASGDLVRREDWDSLSDWGQLVRVLKLGSHTDPVGVWVGKLEDYTLFMGHLVRRYSNQLNPDYHPAGAYLSATLGPLPFYTEVFTSDVLGARLTGAVLAVDVEHVLFGKPRRPGRYALSVSAVHDWGLAGGQAPSVTLAHMDAMVVVIDRGEVEAHLLAGWGTRPGQVGAWGAVAGLGFDLVSLKLDLLLRLEVRQQRGGFRQGFFGPDYELARFQAAGTAGVPLAQAPFPEGLSFYGEGRVGWDAVEYGGLQQHLLCSLAVEAFNWGRVDVDGRAGVQLLDRNLELGVKGMALGLGRPGARYLGAAEVRARFLWGRVYVMGTAGTLLFPHADGTLRPGAFASVGLGADTYGELPRP